MKTYKPIHFDKVKLILLSLGVVLLFVGMILPSIVLRIIFLLQIAIGILFVGTQK